jgi:hypothetical protein
MEKVFIVVKKECQVKANILQHQYALTIEIVCKSRERAGKYVSDQCLNCRQAGIDPLPVYDIVEVCEII